MQKCYECGRETAYGPLQHFDGCEHKPEPEWRQDYIQPIPYGWISPKKEPAK